MYLPKSKNELKVIKALLEYPKRDWVLKDISEESGVPKTTVWRAINRLDGKGLVEKSMAGNTSIIKIENRHVLEKIVETAFAEVEEMRKNAEEYAEELKEIDGVESCILFGSVARGTADFESDIDILILATDENVEKKVTSITDRFSSKKSMWVMPDVMEKSRFEEMKKYGEDFAKEIENEGVVLLEESENE